jgi:hypothetical protein
MNQDDTIAVAQTLMELVEKSEKLHMSDYTQSLDLFSECYQVVKHCNSKNARLAAYLLVFTDTSSDKKFKNRKEIFEAFAVICQKLWQLCH